MGFAIYKLNEQKTEIPEEEPVEEAEEETIKEITLGIAEFDTINRIYTPYATLGRPGIWPEILKSFARTLLQYPVKNPWDQAFCLDCLQLKEAMPYEAVCAYLRARRSGDREYTNIQIYSALKSILGELSSREEETERMPKKEGTLLML